jgi:hypothetical protein
MEGGDGTAPTASRAAGAAGRAREGYWAGPNAGTRCARL